MKRRFLDVQLKKIILTSGGGGRMPTGPPAKVDVEGV